MNERSLSFFVPGCPAPGGSKKAFIPKGWTRAVVTDAGGQKNKDWRAAVALAAYEAIKTGRWEDGTERMDLLEGPLLFSCTFVMPRLKSHYGKKGLKFDAPYYHTSRPDVLKLARSTEDAMSGVVYQDDSQIAIECLWKVYGEKTGAHIRIEEVTQVTVSNEKTTFSAI